ncbi:type VI secretion system baseplate subunit TssE [Aliiruegeria sabulilitoris]|uniref:type VI secretion system baseplate subunit TssE n=1 Tax=Aliiruegeria sabulilitoris TaxID=1510458 RepID=UPI00083302C9|nr:type VI secretion system baseplate subunit TssE [Aliiruegeria sabulilitoris]NDR59044.1 type VI secretion system baseplate subunit TssE [Pseudoruegeria sp. M32A2M]
MADKTIDDRLQPSLLDRLTDNAPDDRSESRDTRVIDVRKLREILKRDLAWLLNTTNNESFIDRKKYPHASRSVLNYGVKPVAGGSTTQRRVENIRQAIVQAVREFEPRLRPESLEVLLRDEESATNMSVFFDIHGDMWAQPLPMELYLRSEIDLMTGHLTLEQEG